MDFSLFTIHEDRIAGQGFTSMTHFTILFTNYFCVSSNEDSGCKSRSGSGMEQARNVFSMSTGDSLRTRKGGNSGSTKRQKESPLCCIDGYLSS